MSDLIERTTIQCIESVDDARLDPFFSAPASSVLIDRRFMSALELSGSASAKQGWRPAHLLVTQGASKALVIGYIKTHSYGEYVFDWALADMYQRAGLNYYPKWISAVPFSPITGERVLGDPISELGKVIANWIDRSELSGGHILFSDRSYTPDWVARTTVQFHWHNRQYATFDDYLAQLRSSKRKTVKKERKSIVDAGVTVTRRCGDEIDDELWRVFFECYQITYAKRSGHQGYLNEAFFKLLRSSLSDHVMIVKAQRGDTIIASALFLFDQHALYGRYWGALYPESGLHFECAFYQGIEFAIERGLPKFDAGAQGEHKLIRGFEPTICNSTHYLVRQDANSALTKWAAQERNDHQDYYKSCVLALPFKKT